MGPGGFKLVPDVVVPQIVISFRNSAFREQHLVN